MSDAADERRIKFFEDKEKSVAVHDDRAFEYEKQAIEYSTAALKVMTYLNGGALVAIPAVVTLFKSDAASRKGALLLTAAMFVAGLLSVVGAQACAFFTMARRSEAHHNLSSNQQWLLSTVHYPEVVKQDEATANAKAATRRTRRTKLPIRCGSPQSYLRGLR